MEDRSTSPGQPRFDVAVPDNGYRWWYVDGLSDDGKFGVVVIAFIGSVFSPYYYSARAAGKADPHEHCAINVGLYRPDGDRWAMTERSARHVDRGADWFRVGPSQLNWLGDRLEIVVDERSAPFRRRMRGRIVVHPGVLNRSAFHLDPGQRHRWRPIAPHARIEVDFASPPLSWRGDAYVDTNAGSRPLEDDFRRWNWSRSNHAGRTAITYAVTHRDDGEHSLAIEFDDTGALTEVEVPGVAPLPRTGWLVERSTRSHAAPHVVRTLEDTPFYARSVLGVADEPRLVMHESLCLDRFKSGWVRFLLPFRMPRVS